MTLLLNVYLKEVFIEITLSHNHLNVIAQNVIAYDLHSLKEKVYDTIIFFSHNG